MDDLISRQDAIEHYYNEKKYITRSRTILSAICLDMKSTIDSLSSAQPGIIRCKDCKWYEMPDKKIYENCVRWADSNGILLPISPDDYCSYAERRTDE